MLIKQGFRFRTIQAPSFHKTFGTVTEPVPDFNLDAGLRPQPNQNEGDPIFGTFPQPEGCGGEGIASVMGDLKKALFNPYRAYEDMGQAQYGLLNQNNQPIDLDFILNEPITSGVQDINGNVTRSPQWYEVTPLNGSLFQGIISALQKGQCSVAMASTWYQSFDTPVQGVVPPASGLTSGHFWKFCGVKTLYGVPYLIAAPWLGPDWGENGLCYFSEAIVNALDGQAFTPNESAQTEPIPVSVQTILQSLINFMKRLLSIEGGTAAPVGFWQQIEDDIEIEYDKLFPMNITPTPQPENTPVTVTPTQPSTAPTASTVPVAASIDTLVPWDTTTSLSHANWHNVRVLCDLEGLSVELKDILTACVWVESAFTTHAVNKNYAFNAEGVKYLASVDNGICQWNNVYHGTEITPDQSINDPEMAVRLMARYFLAGKENQWVSFTSKEYLAHMGKTL